MRPYTLAALAFGLLAAPLFAQDPAPKQSVDDIAGKITSIDKQQAELAKQRSALVGDLKGELQRIAAVVEKLNLNGPVIPPVPPPTPPVPPAPVDPLKAKLKTAFDADPVQLDVRKSQALDLAALYRQAATLAADSTVLTAGELLTRVREAAKTLVGPDSLKGVRTVASAELGAILPTDTTLTDDQRKAAATLFAKLAAHIEEAATK